MRYWEAGPFLAVIRKRYPKLKWSDIKVYDQGKRHVVMVVSECEVFRFAKNEEVARRMEAGILFANIIRPMLPVKIPDQKFVCDVENRIVYSTYRFLTGVTCKPRLFARFNKAKQIRLARCVGNCLSIIHSYPLADARRLGIEIYNEQEVYDRDYNDIARKVFPLVDDAVKK